MKPKTTFNHLTNNLTHWQAVWPRQLADDERGSVKGYKGYSQTLRGKKSLATWSYEHSEFGGFP